jgi:putative transposase
MARLPRLEVAHWPHLIVQRVHDGQLLARDDVDRALLLQTLREAARAHEVSIHAYCLAPDHFHLLLTPAQDTSLRLFMQTVGRRYVSAYNRRHGRQGGLWAGRYRATVLDPAVHGLDAMVWVETHGQRAGGGSPLQDDAWSSARHHLGRCSDPLISDLAVFWSLGNTPFEREAAWRRRLEAGVSVSQARQLAEAMHKGWALLSAAVLPAVEAVAGRRLAPRPRGRPRKALLTSDASTDQ